jgi:hypothetical protein
MMEPLSIPVVTTLKSTDAIAIRQIVSSLIQAIDLLRKDVEALKVSSKIKPSYEKYGVKR